ncbi:MAG: CCA tRNA nucleotidyltransferase [Thermoleophilia bacterium]|nr:CCA tRNA nucleotidyltransferase [Thermoleophilia bacterium]
MAWQTVADYVRSLGLDAWMVGGAVRDELLRRPVKDTDFVVPGFGFDELKRVLAEHGHVEDLVVGGQNVGVRLYPRDASVRALAPAGVEFAPPRIEESTGPGRHDFEIVADGSIPLEQDMERRDFTINAIAKRLSTGEVLDPLDGRGDLERRLLRTTGPTSFRDDPLRIVRGLRFVSELDLDADEQTLAQMREWAPHVALVSGERIGGGLAADSRGELSKLLLGARPAKALRLARDTGVLTVVLPEYEAAIGFDQATRWHEHPLDEHHFVAVQAAADAGANLAVRLALLLHDLGKPAAAWRDDRGRLHYYANPALGMRAHEEIGAEIASNVLTRLRYPTELRARVRRIVREHGFSPPEGDEPVRARRFLRTQGAALARDLVVHKEADLRGKGRPVNEDLERLERFRDLLEAERESPYRVADLAVDGDDLMALGYREGPELGRALERLLDDVVADPARNRRDWLEARAVELLAA